MRFATFLMMDEDGGYATDADGAYIQLFDEKGNLLVYNEDVIEYLKSHSGDGENRKLAAKERVFFLKDGKLYYDESGNLELTDLSKVMPAIFKYGTIESGYTLESDNGVVYISPLNVNGESVYVARVGGTYEALPAFTISADGRIGYFEKGYISNGENQIAFVYDANYFYDENLNQLISMDVLVPEAGDENSPMFAGYYISNGDDRRQLIDIDGSIVLSAGDYMAMVGSGAGVEAEYCYIVNLYADGADALTIYSDMGDGSLYNDYQRMNAFENIGGDLLWQVSSDGGRGHFAGYYRAGEEDGSFVRLIDESGNLIADNDSSADGNREYYARFYHVLTADGSDEGTDVYFSDGKVYSDPELMNAISNISEVTGELPDYYEEEIQSEEEDPEGNVRHGVVKRYFLGYYFATGFGEEDEEGSHESEMLLSEYEEEGFDPSGVELNKVRFTDRAGNIVFDPDNSPAIDGDMAVYQNWFTVTIWDDGEVEISEEADETDEEEDPEVLDEETEEEDPEALDEETEEVVPEGEEKTDKEKTDEGNKQTADVQSTDGETEVRLPGVEQIDNKQESSTGNNTDAQNADTSDASKAADTDENNKQDIEETAKPSDKNNGIVAPVPEGSGDGDGSNGKDGENVESGDSNGSKESQSDAGEDAGAVESNENYSAKTGNKLYRL